MNTKQIRQAFIDFYASKGHTPVASSSLVPGNDPTLLFTNAGMVPFKDVFLGEEKRPYSRAVSSQRCVRAGGKHNDLENVGYTARHHTFFEMLGNFSFGDYFKREAIAYAWEFLTETLNLPQEKLWITVFEEDQEAEDIWLKEIGVSAERFSRIGAKDNFWSMGDTGPCGPCSEIFYDHGEHVAGGPPGTPEEDGDRYIEIWNLVFMQYNQSAGGKREPLPKPSVDTGMGLERLAAVLQGVHANYEIDLFQNLLAAVQKATGANGEIIGSHKVIADHIRSCAFLVADGVLPSNEGRGYVLRRIIRRAIRHGYKLGCSDAFFHKLVAPLASEMGEAYPELVAAQAHVEKVLLQEEQRFAETLDQGMKLLENDIASLKGKEIPGETLFRLYDTYGFPVDLTADIARERGLTIDETGFAACMEKQREGSRSASQFGVDYNANLKVDVGSEFTGYDSTQGGSKVVALVRDGKLVDEINSGDEAAVILAETPFYAESGGQVGDTGTLNAESTEFTVADTQKQTSTAATAAHAHIGTLTTGSIKVGDSLVANVDAARREAIKANHSATHLLHAALRKVLGDHVQQKGSLVNDQRLRFDFSHYQGVTAEEITEIETLVNEQVRQNQATETSLCSYDAAIEKGAMALFGEKYGDEVRVLNIGGDFSVELCGGTHVTRTGDIGLIKVVAESGVAAGVRRIEAVSGESALTWLADLEKSIDGVAALVKANRDTAGEKVQQLVTRNRELEKELEKLKGKLASSQGSDLAGSAVDVQGLNVIAAKLDGADLKTLRSTMDQLKEKVSDAVIMLASVEGGKVRLVAGVSKTATDRVHAGKLIGAVAEKVGGKGGGRPDMAQAGGTDPSQLEAALAAVPELVQATL